LPSSPASPIAGGSPPACPPASPTLGPAGSAHGWWADRVFYEVFVRSFADGNGDGIGDLRGLTGRLDYLNDGDPATTSDLGVTGLWLMPVMESPSYHGYDVVDYRKIEHDYGTSADFRALVEAAHRRGIAVIVDFPINHTSRQHPWFQDSRKAGSPHAAWYVWSSSPPGGPGWQPDGDRWYFAMFGADLPDLNLREPMVTAELTSIARFWLDDLGVDGFRLDAAKHLIEDGPVVENTPETHAWLGDFHRAIHATAPDALLLGEVWDLSPVSASYVPDGLDLTFEFGLAGAYVDALRRGSAGPLADALAEVSRIEAPDGFGAFLANHDMDRIASQLGGDPWELRLAADLLLTGPGVPFIYYGEEIGMTGRKPDERIRSPMQWDATGPAGGFSPSEPWEALSADWRTVNVAAETGDPGSLLSRYRDLVRLRGAHPALGRGAIVPAGSGSDAVVATLRSAPGERLLVVANLSAAPVSDYSLDLPAGTLCGSLAAEVILGPGRAESPTVLPSGGLTGYRPLSTLPAWSVTVVALHP
jgi:glycosidase